MRPEIIFRFTRYVALLLGIASVGLGFVALGMGRPAAVTSFGIAGLLFSLAAHFLHWPPRSLSRW